MRMGGTLFSEKDRVWVDIENRVGEAIYFAVYKDGKGPGEPVVISADFALEVAETLYHTALNLKRFNALKRMWEERKHAPQDG